MNASRWWTEAVAALGDRIPLWLVASLLLLIAGLTAAAWYWFPAWVPRRWPRWRRPSIRLRWPRWRRPSFRLRWTGWRRRKAPTDAPPAGPDDASLLHLPPEMLHSLADQLAAAGDYAGAIRERLRAMVRELIEQQVLEHRPGWTVVELAAAVGQSRPTLGEPMHRASGIFSEVWYGQRPAQPEHDAQMRALADQLQHALAGSNNLVTTDRSQS